MPISAQNITCCESAKTAAKQSEHQIVVTHNGEKKKIVGNWVDFQICKNVQAKNLAETRKREYLTSAGETLLRRPYICSTTGFNVKDLENWESIPQLDELISEILYFNDQKKIPKSFSKAIRNTYALGRERMTELSAFLKSRDKKMPDGSDEMYINGSDDSIIARWYDALELMDLYLV